MWFAGAFVFAFIILLALPWHRIHAVWFSRRGTKAYAEGDLGEATRHWKRVAASPLADFARAGRASLASIALSRGEYAAAISLAESLLENVPSTPEWSTTRSQMYLTLAHAHAWRNDRAKASAALAHAAALDGPEYATRAAVATAAVLLRKNDPEGALAALEHRVPVSATRGFLRAAYCAELLRHYALAQTKKPRGNELDACPPDELRLLARGWKELETFVAALLASR